MTDVFKAYKNANYFDPYKDNIQCIAGNYMIIQYAKNVYAALCHLQKDSVQVTVGQYVKAGIMWEMWDTLEIHLPHIYIFSLWTVGI